MVDNNKKIGFVTYEKESAKDDFIKAVKDDFSFKSYFDRNIGRFKRSKVFVWVLSGVSMIAGLTAFFSVAMMTFGSDDTLLMFIESKPLLSVCFVAFSGLLLYFIEKGKHHQYNDGLTEKKRQTDDNGKSEIRSAVLLQVVSIVICLYGALQISNEIAGTKAASKLAAIDAKYDSEFNNYDNEIAKAEQEQKDFKKLKTWRGKLSDDNTKTYNGLGAVVTDWGNRKETAKAAKEAEILSAGLGDARYNIKDAAAAYNIIYIMCGIQIAVEIGLFLLLRWMVSFRYRVKKENDLSAETQHQNNSSPAFSNINTNAILNQTQPNTNTITNRIVPIHERHKHKTKTAKTVVVQQTQTNTNNKTKVFDYSQTKSNLKVYYNRIKKDGYSDARFKGVQRYAGALIENGYSVDIGSNKKQTDSIIIDDKDKPTLQKNERYEITYEGQIYFFYPRLVNKIINKS